MKSVEGVAWCVVVEQCFIWGSCSLDGASRREAQVGQIQGGPLSVDLRAPQGTFGYVCCPVKEEVEVWKPSLFGERCGDKASAFVEHFIGCDNGLDSFVSWEGPPSVRHFGGE